MTPEQIAALRIKARAEVATWPPLTPELARRVGAIFGVDVKVAARTSEYELEERRKMYEREAAIKAAKALAESLTACDVCNLQPDAHRYMQATSIDSHEWTPGRADKVLALNAPKSA